MASNEAYEAIASWFGDKNDELCRDSLGDRTPSEVCADVPENRKASV